MVTLGDNIRKARKKMGLTQEEVASVIGVTSQAVSRWESGSGMPDISLLVPLAQTLSVSIDSLFGYEQQERSETTYIELSREFEKIEEDAATPLEAIFTKLDMLEQNADLMPGNSIYATCYVEKVAALTRHLYDERAQQEWPDKRNRAIRLGTQVIRSCQETEWVERTHYALAFVYMADKDFESSREHIMRLPSVDSNRLRESILAQLTYAEKGVDEMKNITEFNLQKFARAMNKEVLYAAETLIWNNRPEDALEIGSWGIRLMHTFEERDDLIPYCRGFFRDIYKVMIVADLKKEDYDQARIHWNELQAGMNRHYEYYQKVLGSDQEMAMFTDRQLGRMRSYTPELIRDKQDEILNIIKKFLGQEVYDKFTDMI